MKYLNIAAYHFFRVPGFVETSRKKFKRFCVKNELKGTVLLAREGINCMISGLPENVEKFKDFVCEFVGSPDVVFKESWSEEIAFNRMLVKAKQQLIPVNDPEIDPENLTGARISPEDFKKWIDEKKEMVILDTRNQFEYQIGTFEGAKQLHIDNFRDYEDKLKEAPQEWKEKPIVMFCTGGIRCEKASPLMMKYGYKEVYQLDGGILNYFEKIGGEHYKGDCFVFDKRVALKTNLEESDVVECFKCRHPVTPEEQKLPAYQYEKSCPYCYDQAVEG